MICGCKCVIENEEKRKLENRLKVHFQNGEKDEWIQTWDVTIVYEFINEPDGSDASSDEKAGTSNNTRKLKLILIYNKTLYVESFFK